MLEHGYGVLAGTLTSFWRDTPDDQGRWFHVNLQVSAGGNSYRAAVDVDSAKSAIGVQWKTVVLRPLEWSSITSLSPGYHGIRGANPPHPGTPAGGALDYIRDARFQPNPGCLFVMAPSPFIAWLNQILRRVVPPWQVGNNEQAATALEASLQTGQRVWIFGEPFTSGLGMHNVHQNQGDPLNSQWADTNGIWQDGATIVEVSGGGLVAFLNKFSSQSSSTDDHGNPS